MCLFLRTQAGLRIYSSPNWVITGLGNDLSTPYWQLDPKENISWKLYSKLNDFIRNVRVNVVCQMGTVLCRPQCDKIYNLYHMWEVLVSVCACMCLEAPSIFKVLIKMRQCSFNKIHTKLYSEKYQPFHPCFYVLNSHCIVVQYVGFFFKYINICIKGNILSKQPNAVKFGVIALCLLKSCGTSHKQW